MKHLAHVTMGLLAAVMVWRQASAAVVESQPTGFAIELSVHIAASPDKVYATLTRPSLWWNSAHTFSGSASNLSIDPRAGGCFCEKLANGGSVQHAVVVDAEPTTTLRLRGPLGPFQGQGVDSALSFQLKSAGDGTDLTLENVVGGYMKGGFGPWGERADAMLSEQLTRLKAYLETGSPEPKS